MLQPSPQPQQVPQRAAMSFPHQSWKGEDGRSGDGGTPDPYCNPFLILQTAHAKGPISPNMESRKRPTPDTLYGVLDQAEILENGSVVLIFGTVAGDWLQAQINAGGAVPTGAAGTAFYASMPLYLLEVRYEVSGLMAIAAAATLSALLEPALQTLEGIWVKITLGGSAQRASLFDNLFGAPTDVGVISIELAVDDASQFLNSLDPLDPSQGTRDATETEIENALTAASSFDEIAIYDVGQGSANGFISGREVGCYFDFGGGAAANTSTFPTALVNFCQCKKPPIILSHWDHDHWSSEGRDTRVHTQTWIAPRQVSASMKRAPHHSALIAAIRAAGGSVLVWPSSLHRKRIGQLEISLCTGSSKNTSGLALEAHPPSQGTALPALMPADAGYNDLRTKPVSGQYDAIVCPHHGGRSNFAPVPNPPHGLYQRLFYSYGPKNTYHHPLHATYDPHHSAAWSDNRSGVTVPTPPPHIVRNTEDRKYGTLGHIGFDWSAVVATSTLACGADLDIQQR